MKEQIRKLIINIDNNQNHKYSTQRDPSEFLTYLTNILNETYYNLYYFENYAVITKPKKKPMDPNIDDIEPVIKQKMQIRGDVNNIEELIKLIELHPKVENLEYDLTNMENLYLIKDDLIELNNMIGMRQLKNQILDQILYFSQGLHKFSNDFLHTVIYGAPGTGKTEIAKIMGKIYSKLGILKKGIFKKATRSDFVAGYLGQTAIKTKELIESCLGGVLFIDEAYALGNPEKKDSFAKEALDTLCEALSDHKNELMVIIAGYEEELDTCFFDYNQGLESRFIWRFKTDKYTANDLKQIFLKMIGDAKWKIDESIFPEDWFEIKMSYFRYYGRDMETLFTKIKIAHGKRIFGKESSLKTILTLEDLDNGFNNFIDNEKMKKRKEKLETQSTIYKNLYI